MQHMVFRRIYTDLQCPRKSIKQSIVYALTAKKSQILIEIEILCGTQSGL